MSPEHRLCRVLQAVNLDVVILPDMVAGEENVSVLLVAVEAGEAVFVSARSQHVGEDWHSGKHVED